jgi:hypothetical protein
MNTHIETAFILHSLWSVRPQSTHNIKVLSGRAWVTLVGDLDADNPDHVLLAGDTLCVPTGQHLVVEAWPRHANDTLMVAWQALAHDDSTKTASGANSTLA